MTAEVANQAGLPDLYRLGMDAFNDSVVFTCLIGGIIILVVAIVVWALIPRGLKINDDVDSRGDEAIAERALHGAADGEPSSEEDAAGEGPASTLDADGHADAPRCTPPAAVDQPRKADPAASAPIPAALAEAARTQAPPGMVMVHVPLDVRTDAQMRDVCGEIGLTSEVAMGIFARTVARERRIPFSLELNPRHSASNGATETAPKAPSPEHDDGKSPSNPAEPAPEN